MFSLLNGLERTQELRASLTATTSKKFNSASFFSETDIEAVKQFGSAFAPEFERLKNASPTVESIATSTPGELGGSDASPSKLLFGKDYAEVNRTIVGMLERFSQETVVVEEFSSRKSLMFCVVSDRVTRLLPNG